MSPFHRILLVCVAGALTATGCAMSPPRQADVPRIHPGWEVHMAAGLACSDLGDLDEAARHYRRAVRVARVESLPEEELAFSVYRLGDVLRERPDLARGETAHSLLDEARAGFEHAYGPQHPVLLPVWARIASIHDERGEPGAAEAARAAADHIAVRFFPESHFLRERFGAARPAALLHPLEVLAILGAEEDDTGRVVQSEN